MSESTVGSPDPAAQGPKKPWLRLSVGVALIAVSVVVVVESEESREAITSVSPGILSSLIAMQIAYALVDSYRFLCGIPERHRLRVPFWEWTRVFANGRLLNNTIPQSGTAYRAATMRQRWRLPISTFIVSFGVVTWFGNAILLTVVGLVLFGVQGSEPWLSALYLLTGVLVMIGFVLGYRIGQARDEIGLPRTPLGRTLSRRLVSLMRDAAMPPSIRWRVALGSISVQTMGFLIYWMTLAAMDISGAPLRAIVLYAASTVTTFVSLTPAGLGITELASALVGTAVALPASLSILVVLIVRVSGLVGVAILSTTLTVRSVR